MQFGSESIVVGSERGVRIGAIDITVDKSLKSIYILGCLAIGSKGGVNLENSDIYGARLAGGAHTHGSSPYMDGYKGYTNNFFSCKEVDEIFQKPGDLEWANENKVPIYLSNPAGELRVAYPRVGEYKAGDEKGKLLRTDMPYDPYEQHKVNSKNNRPAYSESILKREYPKPSRNDEKSYAKKTITSCQ